MSVVSYKERVSEVALFPLARYGMWSAYVIHALLQFCNDPLADVLVGMLSLQQQRTARTHPTGKRAKGRSSYLSDGHPSTQRYPLSILSNNQALARDYPARPVHARVLTRGAFPTRRDPARGSFSLGFTCFLHTLMIISILATLSACLWSHLTLFCDVKVRFSRRKACG